MKKQLLILSIMVLLLPNLLAQSYFTQSINNDTFPRISGLVVPDNDKRFFLNITSIYGDSSIMLKFDKDGAIIWQQKQKRFGILYNLHAPAILNGMVNLDTTLLVLGRMTDFNNDAFMLMRFSRSGDLLSHVDFRENDAFESFVPSLITIADSTHVIISGDYLNKGFTKHGLAWVRVKLDGSDQEEVQVMKSNRDLFGVKLLPLNKDGQVIVATYAGDYYPPDPPQDNFPRIFKMDSDGNYIWIKDFILPYNVTLADIIRLSDGGYVMIGNGKQKAYLLKTNEAFEPQWMKSVEFPDTTATGPFPKFNAIIEKGNHLLIAGSQRTLSFEDQYSLLVETDSLGNLLQAMMDSSGKAIQKMAALYGGFTLLAGLDQYDHVYLSTTSSIFYHLCGLSSVSLNCYSDSLPLVSEPLLFPYPENFYAEQYDFVRFDQNLSAYNSCEGIPTHTLPLTEADPEFSIFPNPGDGNINISFNFRQKETVIIRILDLTGRELYSQDFGHVNGFFLKELELSNFSSGTYLLQTTCNGRLNVKKFMILH